MSDSMPRAFGTTADLAIDFAGANRPALVTQILAHCLPAQNDAHWWQRTVSERTAGLLRVVSECEEQSSLSLQARCPAPQCAELLAFELPLEDLLALAAPTGSVELSLPGGGVRLRRPTGDDLRQWRQLPTADHRSLMRTMMESLLLEGDIGDGDEAALRHALSDTDPLVAFAVDCQCPACGTTSEVEVDLENIALQRLRLRQDALLREIHLLASRYGWSEDAIAALPAARRARYVALIEN